MKKLFTILAAIMLSMPILAQKDAEAKKVLDATANKLMALKGVQANFQITNFVGKVEQGSSSGVMCIDGKKYKIESPQWYSWFDGKTLWTYLPDNDEVNVTTPKKAEQQAANPYSFIALYRSGYNYTLTKTTMNGAQVYEILLTAQSTSADIQEARVNISTDYLPMSVRIRQGKNNWTRIRISNIVGKQKFGKDAFKFNKSKYPTAEVIDLR